MGKYIDINKVLEATIEVPQKYWEVEELMREKPNFDKSVGSKKIYERKEYADGYNHSNDRADCRGY